MQDMERKQSTERTIKYRMQTKKLHHWRNLVNLWGAHSRQEKEITWFRLATSDGGYVASDVSERVLEKFHWFQQIIVSKVSFFCKLLKRYVLWGPIIKCLRQKRLNESKYINGMSAIRTGNTCEGKVSYVKIMWIFDSILILTF